MKTMRIVFLMLAVVAMMAGCSRQEEILTPQTPASDVVYSAQKNGTETLGTPSIAIADGSGFAEGGVGMVGVASGTLDIDVPMGSTVNQALLYWAGGTTGAPGDDAIMVDGMEIQGELIGGPVDFFSINGVHYHFSAYRADITDMALVSAGANSFTITGFDFDNTGGPLDENNGVSILAIYDDGSMSDLSLVDGLDMAFFKFAPTLDATVPQTFTFNAEGADRTAQMVVIAGSVGEGRPNQIKVTTSAGDQMFTDVLGSFDALLWDSLILDVMIPAGDTSLTVQLISTDSEEPLGASLGWLASGLSVPRTPDPEPASIGDYVWIDTNMDGIQDPDEMPYPGVVVHLMDCMGNILAETMTDANGFYLFSDLDAGDYNIHFMLPEGYVFTMMNQGMDPAMDSDADPMTGATACTTLDPGENDMTWDAGVYRPADLGCSLTIGFWKNHAGFGPQDDVVTPLLPLWLGDMGGDKSMEVTDAAMAVSVLKVKDFGGNRNGIAKLYAQLLATKLNIAHGASDGAVADAIADADAFLADHDYMDWGSLSKKDQKMVLSWKSTFDDYNNGDIGPGHCDDWMDGDDMGE